jgi:hypothetical protein
MLVLLGGLAAAMQEVPAYAAIALPAPYEDLVQLKSRRVDALYLLPGVDFRTYTKIMIDPAQVAFRKDWLKSANRSRGVTRPISDSDAQQIAQAARSGVGEIFAAAFKAKGYEIVTEPAPDVLRLSPSIANLYINAPQPLAGGVSRTYTVEAGEATLALEARDSTTGAVLALVIDRSSTSNAGGVSIATPTSNRADFENLFMRWADICVRGFEQLRTTPPVQGRKAQ